MIVCVDVVTNHRSTNYFDADIMVHANNGYLYDVAKLIKFKKYNYENVKKLIIELT